MENPFQNLGLSALFASLLLFCYFRLLPDVLEARENRCFQACLFIFVLALYFPVLGPLFIPPICLIARAHPHLAYLFCGALCLPFYFQADLPPFQISLNSVSSFVLIPLLGFSYFQSPSKTHLCLITGTLAVTLLFSQMPAALTLSLSAWLIYLHLPALKAFYNTQITPGRLIFLLSAFCLLRPLTGLIK